MRWCNALVFIVFLTSTLAGNAECIVGWEKIGENLNTDAPKHNFDFVVDSIDYRPDLTRIYGQISGTPHIAVNVKLIVISTDGKNAFYATDTDGFDLDKYFQFEENPTFKVEFDFEPIAPSDSIFLAFLTSNGIIAYNYTANSTKSQDR